MIKITIEIEDKKEVGYVDDQHVNFTPIKLDTKATLNPPPKEYKVKGVRTCAKCGKEFQPSGQAQKYCSEKCGLKHKSEKEKIKNLEKRKGIPKINPIVSKKAKICRTCKKEFTNYTSNSQLYCSDECKNGGIIIDIHKDDPIIEPLSDVDKISKPEFSERETDINSNIITKIRDKIFPKGKQNIINQPGEMNLKTISKEQIEKSKDHPYELDR